MTKLSDLPEKIKEIAARPVEVFSDIGDDPIYEAEDIGCTCNDCGIESEWDWAHDQSAYVCAGCGEVQ